MARSTARKSQTRIKEARDFLRSYTEGMQVDSLRQLFQREAADVYEVLARDRSEEEPEEDFKRFLHRAKVVFLGLSYKLSPPRRLLFALCLVLALAGLFDVTLNLEFSKGDVAADFSPLFFLASVAGLVYLLAAELVDRVRFRDELEVARQLQRDLLPEASPTVPEYAFAHSYRTANTIGGDYYDFIALPDGRLAVLVGDASGHGIAAGLLMAIAHASLRTALDQTTEPRAVLELLNRVLCRTGDNRAFMTMFFGILDPASHRLDWSCAGHPFPILRRAGGQVTEIGTTGSLPLGLRPAIDVRADTLTLDPGDVLVVFSDGLPEALDDGSRAFGFERLRHLVTEIGTPATLHDRILTAFRQHVGSRPIADDLTLVVLARDPEGLPPLPPPAVV